MGDLASDREAGFELVREEIKKLEKYDRNHPLLTLDNEEFADKYAPDESTTLAAMAANYFIDLARAVDEYTGENRFPIRENTVDKKTAFNLEDMEDPDFPF